MMPRLVLIALGIAVALTAASDPATRSESAAKGKHVHIVNDRCPDGCEFKTWTTTSRTTLRATPNEASAVVTELAMGEPVQGIAARTITTYLPLCTFILDEEGQRPDCVKPECERVQFRSGEEFFYREHQGLWSLIEYRDSEFVIPNRVAIVNLPSGRYEGTHNYKCDEGPVFKVWVQVSLPNGTTGWADRKNFDGTETGAGIIGGPSGGTLGVLSGETLGGLSGGTRSGILGRRPARRAVPVLRAPWRVAAIAENSLFLVDIVSIERSGAKVAFRMDHRSILPLITGTGALREQVDADCVSRNWTAKSSPGRQIGQDVITEAVHTTVAAPGSAYDAVLTAACTGTFTSGGVVDPFRFAEAYFGTSGSVGERLDAAARTQDGSVAPAPRR